LKTYCHINYGFIGSKPSQKLKHYCTITLQKLAAAAVDGGESKEIPVKCQYLATKLQDDPTVSVVFKILSMCVVVFCVVCGPVSPISWFFFYGF
jgi:hypothetical protein